jgi:lysine biosynthesis protein LysW
MQTARCPICRSDVIIGDEAYEGDLVDCVNCGEELEIVALRPPQVKKIEEETDNY